MTEYCENLIKKKKKIEKIEDKSLNLTETVLTLILQTTKLHTMESKKDRDVFIENLKIQVGIDWEISIFSRHNLCTYLSFVS